MGKVLFSIVLVAAAFAGGAAINGPGLRWVQGKVGLLAAGDEDGAATDKDQSRNQNPPAAGALVTMGEVPAPLPVAPVPTMTKAPDVATAPIPEPKAPAPPDVTPLSLDEPPKPAPAPATEAPSAGPPRLEPPSAKDEPRAARATEPEPGPPWSDMPGSAPAAAVGPRPQARANPDLEPTPPSGSEPRPAPAGDWAELRSKMRALGVARYGIEGEPGGRVRFHCLIPLAGRRAVGQQFEAEGSDEIQAAQAALRRVALWRATEGEHAAPPRPAD